MIKPSGTDSLRTGTKSPETPPEHLGKYIFDPDHVPPQEPVFYEGLLAAEDLMVWLGREKHRKTNVILQFSMAAAVGRDFLVFPFSAPKPARVVVIDYETKTQSLRQRFRAISTAAALTETERLLLKANLQIIEVRKLLRAGYALPRFPVNTRSAKGQKELDRDESFWRQLVRDQPADIYVFDPMRSMHSADENDSMIESLLSRLRRCFRGAAVIVAHHMRKSFVGGNEVTLASDMRLWSDGARGSSAIKAHADVIVCQERVMDQGNEVLYVGAFLKDGADIEPLRLEESDAQSFFWVVTDEVPDHLKNTIAVLFNAGGAFADYNVAADALRAAGIKKATAYRHLTDLQRHKWLVHEGDWKLSVALARMSNELEDFAPRGARRKKRRDEE